MKIRHIASLATAAFAGSLLWMASAPTSEAQERARQQPRFGFERIYNGKDVSVGDGPWAVVLKRNGKFTCGGSLVDPALPAGIEGPVAWRGGREQPRWVVTAAHCLYDRSGRRFEAADFSVSTGSLKLTITGDGEDESEVLQVRYVMEHEGYDPYTYANDIALLYLAQPQETINAKRRASIALPISAELDWIQEPYTQLYVQGWGASQNGDSEAKLQEVRVPAMGYAYCDGLYRPQGAPLLAGMICAGYARGEFDSCYGDSGGPLAYRPVVGKIDNARLVGVVSWGFGCAEPHAPGVYTSTINFKAWLETRFRRCVADPGAVNCTTKAVATGNRSMARARGNMITGSVILLPEGCEDATPRLCRLGAPLRFEQTADLVWQSDAWSSDDLRSGTTDGASIPAWAQPIIGAPFDRSYLKAAILHDHYCYAENHVRSWQSVHRMFYDALIASGVNEVKARTMYYAVYLGAARWTKLVPGEDCGVNCLKQRSAAGDAAAGDWIEPLYDNSAFASAVAEIYAEQTSGGMLSLAVLAERAEARRTVLNAD